MHRDPLPHFGRVTLVGAGPGDPDMLTVKAVKAIQTATVLFVDDLVSEAIVALAPKSARVVKVGKRGGHRSTPQSFIETLMLVAAQQGETVVRLKGGDPFLFGRGGEEMEHLQAQGIQVEVVNGITAGLAAATALHMPLTHRDCAHGVMFITGHGRPGTAPTDWAVVGHAARQAKLTVVVYMGISGIAQIQDGLLQALPPDTPVAVIQNATLPHQRHACCALNTLQETIAQERLGSPAVIVVGEVARQLPRALQLLATQRDQPADKNIFSEV